MNFFLKILNYSFKKLYLTIYFLTLFCFTFKGTCKVFNLFVCGTLLCTCYLLLLKMICMIYMRGLGTPSPVANPVSHHRGRLKGGLASGVLNPEYFLLDDGYPLKGKKPRYIDRWFFNTKTVTTFSNIGRFTSIQKQVIGNCIPFKNYNKNMAKFKNFIFQKYFSKKYPYFLIYI